MRRASALSAVLLAAALILLPSSVSAKPVQATPEEKTSAIVSPAMVYLEIYWKAWVRVPGVGFIQNGDPFEWAIRCSGFVVEPSGYIVTAGHCVDPGIEGARGGALEQAVDWLIAQNAIPASDRASYLETAYANWGVEGKVKGSPPDRTVYVQHGVALSGLKTGDAKPARVVGINAVSKGDVALLKVEAENLSVVQIAPSSEIQIGTPILSVGYPASTDMVTDQSLEPTFKDGKISAKKTREEGLLPVYEMSAALSGGMSGGPTVDLQGRVVGINSFNIVGETEAFNFISPSSLISEVLTRAGVKNQLGTVDRLYREGLQLYFAGDGKAALTKFDEVLTRVPSHREAQAFKTKAAELAATQKSSPTALIAAIAGGAVVVLAGGFAFARSKRKRTLAVAYPAPAPGAAPYGAPAPPPPAPFTPPAPPAPPEPSAPPAASAPPEPALPPPVVSIAPVGFQPPPPAAPAAPEEQPAAASAPEAAQSAAPHFCSSCGAPLARGAKFCAGCGTAVG
ncbi:MAG: trypsin-like peptidase domain-containing protein [Acidobacteria bacterium]|nr:trypsin-like peptidase domain-containing protein [Acidobacteriota bacterium]